MKTLFAFLFHLVRMFIICLILSAFCSAIFFLGNGFVRWWQFLGGACGFFFLWFLLSCYQTIIALYRMHKDPVFRDAHLRTGITWSEYKRLKKEKKNEKVWL